MKLKFKVQPYQTSVLTPSLIVLKACSMCYASKPTLMVNFPKLCFEDSFFRANTKKENVLFYSVSGYVIILRDFEKNFIDKNMTVVAEQIFKDALGLLPVERVELIEKLFQRFDRAASSNVKLTVLHPQRPSYVLFLWDWKQHRCCIAIPP